MTGALGSFGTSIWLDDLSRAKLTGSDAHSLPHRIKNDGVVGVTTNPSIFSAAISGSDDYALDIASMKGAKVEEVIKAAEAEIWRKTDPAAKARAADVVKQLSEAIANYEKAAAKADAAGNALRGTPGL